MSTADQVPCPALVEPEVQHDYAALDGHHAVVADVVPHLHILAVASWHNALELEVAAEVVDHGDKVPHRDLLVYAVAGCCDVCNCLDDHIDHLLAAARMGLLAYHLVLLQQVHHCA